VHRAPKLAVCTDIRLQDMYRYDETLIHVLTQTKDSATSMACRKKLERPSEGHSRKVISNGANGRILNDFLIAGNCMLATIGNNFRHAEFKNKSE